MRAAKTPTIFIAHGVPPLLGDPSRRRAPGVRLALPTPEHFVPVLVTLGAAADDPAAAVRFPIAGFWGGSAIRRSVQFG